MIKVYLKIYNYPIIRYGWSKYNLNLRHNLRMEEIRMRLMASEDPRHMISDTTKLGIKRRLSVV
jgi:hypothetical protein